MTYPVQSHLDNFVVNLTLGLLPSLGFTLDFSEILVLDTLARSPLVGISGAVTYGTGSKLVEIGETDTIPSSGALSDAAADVVAHIFGAAIHPTTIKFVSVDAAGSDTDDIVALALRDASVPFHAVVVVSNDQAEIASAVVAFNQANMSHPVYGGMDDTDTGSTGVPDAAKAPATGMAAIDALSDALKDQLYLTFHDENGKTPSLTAGAADFAEIAATYAAVDWANGAAGGNLVLKRTRAMAPISQTIKEALDDNNVNHALPSFGTSVYVDAGVMYSGRPVYHIYTRDLLNNKLQLDLAQVKTGYANLRRKLPMDSQGQAVVLNKLNASVQQLQRAQHLLSPEEAALRDLPAPYVRAEAITAEDISDRTLRFSALQYFLDDARVLQLDMFVTT